MAEEKDIRIRIIVDAKDAKKINQVSKALGEVGKSAKKSSDKAKKSLKVISSDVDQTSKTARKFSTAWKVPFKDARSAMQRFGVGSKEYTKNISHDTSQLGQSARKFSKAWGTSIEDSRNLMKGFGVQTKATTTKVEKGVKKMGTSVKKTGKNMGANLTMVAWHFRYLGSVLTNVSKKWFSTAKKWITVAADLQESFFSIRATTALYGQEADKAKDFTMELAEGGLIPLKEAADSVRNLLMTGMGMPELEKFSYRYLDVASLTTSGMDQMKKSLALMSQSILRGTLVLATDVTARKLWTETDKRLQKSIGKTLKELNAQQRAIEILKTLETDYAATVGLHEAEEAKMSATLGGMSTSYTKIASAMGEALRPALELVATALKAIADIISPILKKFAPLISIITVLGISFTALTGIIFSFGGVLWSVGKLGKIFTTVMTSMNLASLKSSLGFNFFAIAVRKVATSMHILQVATWQIWVILGALALVVSGITWLIMKLTGSFDKQKDSITSESKELQRMTEAFENFDDQIEESDAQVITFTGTLDQLIERIGEVEGEISEKRKDYEQSLGRLLLRHTDTWKSAVKDVEEAKEKMTQSLAELTGSHEESTEDEAFAYKRKREDIEAELEREVSKGLWANQIKIKELKKTLARLDEDHNRATKKEDKRYKDKKKTVLQTYKDELEAAKDTMSELTKLWSKHQDEVKEGIRLMKTLPDAFEEIKNSFIENAKDELDELNLLNEAMDNFGVKATNIIMSLGSLVSTTAVNLASFFVGPNQLLDNLKKKLPSLTSAFKSLGDAMFPDGIPPMVSAIFSETTPYRTKLNDINDEIESLEEKPMWKRTYSDIRRLRDLKEEREELMADHKLNVDSYQTGGIVPGLRGQPQLAMVHSGERIIPAGEVRNEGNITININSPVVNEREDINRIATAVSHALGQRTRFARMGAY